MVGGQGNDILIGNGGVDVLNGGAGNDILQIADNRFSKVDGGPGIDSLQFQGAGINLDMTRTDSPDLTGVEFIDLTGTGNNSFTLTALDGAQASDTGTLTVIGDSGDSVATTDLWNRLDDIELDGQAFRHFESLDGANDLLVDQDVEVLGLLSTQVASESIDTFAGGGFRVIGEQTSDRAGRAVSSAGDVNGDGIDDILIGAPENSDTGGSHGAAYVVFGSRTNTTDLNLDDVANGTGGFKIIGEGSIDGAGRSVSSAGDVNGDGIDDVIIGVSRHNDGPDNVGAAYVVFGTALGISTINLADVAAGTGGFKILGENGSDNTGRSVSGLGDINGDGFDDVIVGGPGNDQGGEYAGAAYVIFGTDAVFPTIRLEDIAAESQGFKITGENELDSLGRSVSTAGDVNNDGFDDLLIGARGNDAGGNGAGAAYIVFGSAEPVSGFDLADIALGTGGFKIVGELPLQSFGESVGSAGDMNGDGIDDLVIGAARDYSGGRLAGAAYVIFGTTQDISGIDLGLIAGGTGGFKITGESAYDRIGTSVSSAGDMNGDGFDDLIIGTYDADSDVAYVIFGTDEPVSGIDLSAVAVGIGGFKISSADIGNDAGFSVSEAGDINDDGFDDLLISADRDDDGGHDAGAAYVLFGFDTSTYERPAGADGIFGPVIPDPGSGSGSGSSGSIGFSAFEFAETGSSTAQDPFIAVIQSDTAETASAAEPAEGYTVYPDAASGVDITAASEAMAVAG